MSDDDDNDGVALPRGVAVHRTIDSTDLRLGGAMNIGVVIELALGDLERAGADLSTLLLAVQPGALSSRLQKGGLVVKAKANMLDPSAAAAKL